MASLWADSVLNSTHGGFMAHRHHGALARRDWVKEVRLAVAGGVYDLSSGQVTPVAL